MSPFAPRNSAAFAERKATILHADGNAVTRSVSKGRKAFPRLRFGLQSNVSSVPTRTTCRQFTLLQNLSGD